MSTHKRRSGTGKSKTATDAATLIPTEIRELLGPSPVVDIAEEPIFDRLLAAAVNELNPSGMIEWTLVYDFVVTSWEIRQLREYKTSFLRIENAKHSTYRDPVQSDLEDSGRRQFFMDLIDLPSREIKKKLEEYRKLNQKDGEAGPNEPKNRDLAKISADEDPYKRAFRLSQVISTQAQNIDLLQRMTLMLEKRRDALLRDLDRRQAARLERDAAQPQRDRNATDLETRVDG